jgi:predicted alpha/beta-fold hydrolase
MLNLYLIKEGSNSRLSGAIAFSQPFSMKNNVEFFRKNYLGVFNKMMGINYAIILKSKINEMKEFITQEKHDEYHRLLSEN